MTVIDVTQLTLKAAERPRLRFESVGVKVWCVFSTLKHHRLYNNLCFCIWIEKNQILGKYIVIIDASFLLHTICFTNILRTNRYLVLFYNMIIE